MAPADATPEFIEEFRRKCSNKPLRSYGRFLGKACTVILGGQCEQASAISLVIERIPASLVDRHCLIILFFYSHRHFLLQKSLR
jgi:hypothetical protein